MDPMVRAAGLRGLAPLVDLLGGDGSGLLTRFGIPPGSPDTDDALVRASAGQRVLEVAAAELDRPDLGLRLAERQDSAVLGPLAVAIENSSTLGEALDCTSRFLFVHCPVLSVAQVPDPDEQPGVVGLRYASTGRHPLGPQAADLGLGLFHRIIALLSGGPYGLRSVHLPHPPLVPVDRYTAFFGADVRFDRPDAVLRVPAAFAATPITGGDRMLRDLALDHLATHYATPHETVTARVRTLLGQTLGAAPVRIATVARLLRMHPRTLQRRLAAESTTFEAVLDGVRRAVAHHLITATDLPFGQVTAMVGLTEQSALTRAAHRWFGASPRTLRTAGPGSGVAHAAPPPADPGPAPAEAKGLGPGPLVTGPPSRAAVAGGPVRDVETR